MICSNWPAISHSKHVPMIYHDIRACIMAEKYCVAHTHTSKIDCLIWRWHIIKNNPFNHFGRLFLPICWTPLIFKRIIRVKRTSTMTIFHVYNFERVSEEKQNYFPTLWDFLIVRSSHSSPGEIFKFTGWMVTFRSCETLAILLESPFMCALFEEK